MDEEISHNPEALETFFNEHVNVSIRFQKNGYLDTGKRASFLVVLYQNEEDVLIGALAMEYMVATSVAAALDDLPYDVAVESAENEELPEKLVIHLERFFAACAPLISPDAIYYRFYEYPKNLPAAFYDLLVTSHEELSADVDHSDLFATVRTYGEGQMVFFDDIFSGKKIRDPSWFDSSDAAEEELGLDDDPDLNYEELNWEDFDSGPRFPKGLLFAVGMLLLAGCGLWFFLNQKPHEKTVQLPPIIAVEQVLIKGGSFEMGCPPEQSDCSPDEQLHTVKVNRPFYMMISEVTQDLFFQVMSRNPSEFWKCGDNCPVENISWLEAVKFANLLSKNHRLEACYIVDGRNVFWPQKHNCEGWRLPTEAEWEYAARGASKNFLYAGSNELNLVSWFDESTQIKEADGEQGWYGKVPQLDNIDENKVRPICLKQKNEYGLCDMSGNVWEWTWDIYGADFYSRLAAKKNPIGTLVGNHRVIRGGSWADSEKHNRVYHRSAIPNWATTGMDKAKKQGDLSIIQSGSVGFRLVRTTIVN